MVSIGGWREHDYDVRVQHPCHNLKQFPHSDIEHGIVSSSKTTQRFSSTSVHVAPREVLATRFCVRRLARFGSKPALVTTG
jgi:V8-like Glu-specific endopeptidase